MVALGLPHRPTRPSVHVRQGQMVALRMTLTIKALFLASFAKATPPIGYCPTSSPDCLPKACSKLH